MAFIWSQIDESDKIIDDHYDYQPIYSPLLDIGLSLSFFFT